MSSPADFHSQIASIMEVLANAAVAEICKVVDDATRWCQLEVSQNQKENDFLRRKVRLLELQGRLRGLGRSQKPLPLLRDQDPTQQMVTSSKTEAAEEEEETLKIIKVEGAEPGESARASNRPDTGPGGSTPPAGPEDPRSQSVESARGTAAPQVRSGRDNMADRKTTSSHLVLLRCSRKLRPPLATPPLAPNRKSS
ncbi:hypothetical protein CRUP_026731 [Coryphaenoides rupestris]|nr:hypothetical protein CRUP_026731 [Coryphaenoides rupestris]